METDEELRYLVLAAQREGSRSLTERLRPLGVTPAQAEVLSVLRARGAPISVKELGTLLVCEAGSPSRLARSVIALGLVRPSADRADGRVTLLALTAAGEHRAGEIAEAEAALYAELRTRIPDAARREQLAATLRAYVQGTTAGEAVRRRRAG